MNSKGQFQSDQGFTLIEIMVVMVIISIILSFAVLSIDTGSRQLENEARRIAALFKIASEETVMNSKEYRAVFNRNGYFFYRYEGAGEWTLLEEDLLGPRDLPGDYTVILTLEGEKVWVETGQDDMPGEAAIYFLSSGEVTPFEVELVNGQGDRYLVSNRNGVAEATIAK